MVHVPSGDEQALMDAIETNTVSIAVDASDWMFYTSGILKSSGTGLNHGVQADGFHIHSSDGDYILVRNSWGARWGEEGYIRIDP